MEEREVTLRDYIGIVLRRKWLIICVLLLSIITTVVTVSLRSKPKKYYRVSAIIGTGFLEGEIIGNGRSEGIIKSVEVMEPIIKRLKLNVSIEKLKEMTGVIDINGRDFIKIIVNSESLQEAKRICEEISKEYAAYGNKLYNERRDNIDKIEITAKEQIDQIQKEMADLERTKSAFSNEIDFYKAIRDDRGKLSGYLNLLERMTNSLRKTRDFKIINYRVEYIKPKGKLIVAGSALIGLVLGVLLAFFVEYWQKPLNRIL